MREPLIQHYLLYQVLGITPAHAGTTQYAGELQNIVEDHPRSCGNHRTIPIHCWWVEGSPPLMREPRYYLLFSVFLLRITPAHAGTTSAVRSDRSDIQDHPRSCGNHELRLQALRNNSGSPPLMREPRIKVAGLKKQFRITPALAGTTV